MEIPALMTDGEPVIVNVYDMVSHCYISANCNIHSDQTTFDDPRWPLMTSRSYSALVYSIVEWKYMAVNMHMEVICPRSQEFMI